MNSVNKSLSWNMLSFLIVGVSGVLINVIIGKYYGAEYLGVFNQIFAVYILLSQIAVFGIHLSAIKYISQYSDHAKVNTIISSALILTVIISVIVYLLAINISTVLGNIFSSLKVEESWKFIVFGLIFFALNKTLLATVNALQYMKFFAISQALRYIFALTIIAIFLFYNIDGTKLGLIISLSEVVLFFILIIKLYKNINLNINMNTKVWMMKHFKFGYQSFWGATIGELNTRVDTILLGIFVSDGLVGVYTYALMIFEGFMQIGVVVRNVYNPIIAKLINTKNYNELNSIIFSVKKKFYIFMNIIALIGIVSYPYFVDFTVGNSFSESIYIFYILILSIMITSGFLPFDMLLNQAGYPKEQSIYRMNIVLVNIFFNILLIPLFGIYGAAIGTFISICSRIFFLKCYSRKYIGIVI